MATPRSLRDDPIEFRELSTPDLLTCYGQILTVLRERGITRTEDSPVGGYAEYLAAGAFGLTLMTNSATGYDGVDAKGIRFQVKGRRMTKWNVSRQMSAIRGLVDGSPDPFDFLIGILFNADMTVMRAALIPVDVVRANSRYQPHVNGSRFHLRDAIWSVATVRDITDVVIRTATADSSSITSSV